MGLWAARALWLISQEAAAGISIPPPSNYSMDSSLERHAHQLFQGKEDSMQYSTSASRTLWDVWPRCKHAGTSSEYASDRTAADAARCCSSEDILSRRLRKWSFVSLRQQCAVWARMASGIHASSIIEERPVQAQGCHAEERTEEMRAWRPTTALPLKIVLHSQVPLIPVFIESVLRLRVRTFVGRVGG